MISLVPNEDLSSYDEIPWHEDDPEQKNQEPPREW